MKKIIFATALLLATTVQSNASQREHDPDRSLLGHSIGVLGGLPIRHAPCYYPGEADLQDCGRRPTAAERDKINRFRHEHGDGKYDKDNDD